MLRGGVIRGSSVVVVERTTRGWALCAGADDVVMRRWMDKTNQR